MGDVFTKLNSARFFDVQEPLGAEAVFVVVDVWPAKRPFTNFVTSFSFGFAVPGPLRLVSVVATDHPVMNGVPASFDVTDELYYVNAEPDKTPEGTAPIEVLAQTSPSQKFSKPHPSVWVTKHEKARIVGIALGHDERVHDLGAYQSILTNAVKWVARK